jgi:hypothetical protein
LTWIRRCDSSRLWAELSGSATQGLRLRRVLEFLSRTDRERDPGTRSTEDLASQFSLERRLWGGPSGRVPTTHILKPPTGDWDGHAQNKEQFAAILKGLRTSEDSKSYASRFLVRDGEKELLLSVEKIDWVEAADYYCCLHSGGRCYMLRESISEISERMDSRQFVRYIDLQSLTSIGSRRYIGKGRHRAPFG